MSDDPKPPSEWARKRAAGKARRAKLLERREAYFGLLVSGYSVEQIATAARKSPSAVRRAISQALAKRQLDTPEDYARLQVARLHKALRCADASLETGDLKAIAPFVKVVTTQSLPWPCGRRFAARAIRGRPENGARVPRRGLR